MVLGQTQDLGTNLPCDPSLLIYNARLWTNQCKDNSDRPTRLMTWSSLKRNTFQTSRFYFSAYQQDGRRTISHQRRSMRCSGISKIFTPSIES